LIKLTKLTAFNLNPRIIWSEMLRDLKSHHGAAPEEASTDLAGALFNKKKGPLSIGK